MAARNRTPYSPSLHHSLTASPALSAVRPSPLAAGSFEPYQLTSSPLSSPQALSVTRAESSSSPDFLDDFIYTEEMDDDLRRIDSDVAAIIAAEGFQMHHADSSQGNGVHGTPQTLPRNRATWVVFCGKVPGIYDQ